MTNTFIMVALVLALASCIWLAWWQTATILTVKKDDSRNKTESDNFISTAELSDSISGR